MSVAVFEGNCWIEVAARRSWSRATLTSIGLMIVSNGSRVQDFCSISVICHPPKRTLSNSPKLERGASLVTEVYVGTYVEQIPELAAHLLSVVDQGS